MANESIAVKDYGWSTNQPYHWGYLTPKIVSLVQSLHLSRVLDVGSGNGKLCNRLAEQCSLVVGVEFDEGGVKIASDAYPQIPFFNMGVQDDPAPLIERYPDKFEGVISTEVIEHLYLPRQLLEFSTALLKPRGYLIISTPYHGYLKNLALSLFDGWDHHHTVLRDGGHIKFWSRKTLETLLRSHNFEIVSFHGTGRLPWLWKSMIVVARLREVQSPPIS